MEIRKPLRQFAEIARTSREYQGHGWGCARLGDDGSWSFHHQLRPIWDDDLDRFGPTRLLLAHARSAFRDEGIVVENNMPFHDDRYVFIFNGEVHGVRIREAGRIGAEKIFNFVKRFDRDGLDEALRRGTTAIERRSRYVRAMNVIMADGTTLAVSSLFNEDPDYFTMSVRGGDGDEPLVICSDPWPNTTGWTPIASGEVRLFP